MIKELYECNICGSTSITKVNEIHDDEDVYLVYKCLSCGEYCKQESSVKKPQVNSHSVPTYTAAEIFSLVKENVFMIKSKDNGFISFGSGVAVGNGYILTNAHVVKTDNKINLDIVASDGVKNYNCSIIKIDDDLDLALLKADIAVSSSLNLASHDNLKTGEKVFAIGNSKGLGLLITEGIVSDRARKKDGQIHILISAPINAGSSGGPVFNEKGEMLGIVAGKEENAVGMGYVIISNVIKKFLNA